MLITALFKFRTEDHQKPHTVVGSLSPAKHLVAFEPGAFRHYRKALIH